MVSPMASERLGCGVDQPADVGRQRLPVHREVALVQQLAGPRPDQVEPEDRAVALRDDLHQAVGLAEDHGPAVARERVLVHDDVVPGRPGLRLGHARPTPPRGGCRPPTARRRSRPAPGCSPRKWSTATHGLGVGDVREPRCVDAVADRVDARPRGEHGVRVDLDEPALVDPHARPSSRPMSSVTRAAADRRPAPGRPRSSPRPSGSRTARPRRGRCAPACRPGPRRGSSCRASSATGPARRRSPGRARSAARRAAAPPAAWCRTPRSV